MSKLRYKYKGSAQHLVGTGVTLCFNEGSIIIEADGTFDCPLQLASTLDALPDYERISEEPEAAPEPPKKKVVKAKPEPAPAPEPEPEPEVKSAPEPEPEPEVKPAPKRRRRRTTK